MIIWFHQLNVGTKLSTSDFAEAKSLSDLKKEIEDQRE